MKLATANAIPATAEIVLATPPAGNTALLDRLVAAWLHEKRAARNASERTQEAYSKTMAAFRLRLAAAGLDLDAEPSLVAIIVQAFAGESQSGQPVAVATFNQRIAIISSFYQYCLRMELLPGIRTSPIARVRRQKVEQYATARALDPDALRDRLAAIDLETAAGARDYALLFMALMTGRRVSEIANLQWRDLSGVGSGKVEVLFRRCKGGKQMRDALAGPVAQGLEYYLSLVYPDYFAEDESACQLPPPGAPIWLSFAPGAKHDRSLSDRALRDICHRHFGTYNFHALRHTFAHVMEELGAKISEIQARLGHNNLATTGRYLAALAKAENDQAEALAVKFGAARPLPAKKPARAGI